MVLGEALLIFMHLFDSDEDKNITNITTFASILSHLIPQVMIDRHVGQYIQWSEASNVAKKVLNRIKWTGNTMKTLTMKGPAMFSVCIYIYATLQTEGLQSSALTTRSTGILITNTMDEFKAAAHFIFSPLSLRRAGCSCRHRAGRNFSEPTYQDREESG